MIRIHPIQTGTCQLKRAQVASQGAGNLRQLRLLTDHEWTPPLPILAWAIEHPEGVIVVDTGESARSAEPGYYPRWHPYYRFALRVNVPPEEEIGPRLRALGIAPADVRTVVLTHLHTDHAGGLHPFPRAEVLVSRREREAACGVLGRMHGYLPRNWPADVRMREIPFVPEPAGAFAESHALTRDGAVTVVPTPGHTPGHVSVLVRDGERHVFLAGDATYAEQWLRERRVDGITFHGRAALRTIDTIRAYAAAHPTVYLPSHDPASAARLQGGVVFRPDGAAPPAAA